MSLTIGLQVVRLGAYPRVVAFSHRLELSQRTLDLSEQAFWSGFLVEL